MQEKALQTVEQVTENLQYYVNDKLIGVYLHGSLAMGCYNPESSDVDILAVVGEKISKKDKQNLGSMLAEISVKNSQNIELSIILLNELTVFKYPTSYEFHFSTDNKRDYEKGKIDLEDNITDSDLASQIVVTKKFGKVLYGKPIDEVFPNVNDKYYLNSIAKDSAWSYRNIIYGPNTGTCRVPPYAVLNFCRVLAFIQDNKITSKKTGAEWALKNLPEKFSPIIQAAAGEYKKKDHLKK